MPQVNRKKYKKILFEDRQLIEKMINDGKARFEIAFEIGVHPVTIDRELKRGGYPNYTAVEAQKKLGR